MWMLKLIQFAYGTFQKTYYGGGVEVEAVGGA